MKASWVANEDKKTAEEIRADFISSRLLREKLTSILESKIAASMTSTRSIEKYSLAGWAFMQADAVGYERAMKEVISLISDVSVEKDSKS